MLVVGRLPLVLFSRFTRLRRPRLRNLAVYLGAVAIVLVSARMNSQLAGRRADRLVVAVQSFHAKYARYPETLEELVPEHL